MHFTNNFIWIVRFWFDEEVFVIFNFRIAALLRRNFGTFLQAPHAQKRTFVEKNLGEGCCMHALYHDISSNNR